MNEGGIIILIMILKNLIIIEQIFENNLLGTIYLESFLISGAQFFQAHGGG